LKPATIPIICIPTSLSGGEYSSIAGGTEDQSREKHLFKHNSLMPSLVILSPQLAQTTPQITWLSSGVRSVDHCIETLGSLYSNPAADSVAASSLTALVPALLACKTEPQNEENFLTAQLAVIDAMSAVQKGVRLGGSHAIGHQLGPLGVGHGITSCIMLPAVMAYNAKHGSSNPEILERQKNATEIIWSQPKCREVLTNSGLSQDTAMLADILDMIIRELGMPRTLRDVSVTEEKFDILAANSLKDSLAKFNPVPLKEKDQILEILGMVEGYKGNKS
jgi:alcohol dehydrogenase class IV